MTHAAASRDPFTEGPFGGEATMQMPVIWGRTVAQSPSTIPFPAVGREPAAPLLPSCHCDQCEWAVQVAGGYDGECRCDQCKYGHAPGTDPVLYTGPDSVRIMIRSAVRDGRYEDIPAYADAAVARAHLALNDAARRIRRDMEHAILAVGPERVAAATAAMQAGAARAGWVA